MAEGILRRDDETGAYHSTVKAKKDIIPIRLTPKDRAMLQEVKPKFRQVKDSTILKQLAWYGYYAIHRKDIAFLLDTIAENIRKNKQTGIVEFEA